MIFTVIGNRPQLIKSFPVSRVLKELEIEEDVLYTWQHYDAGLFDNLYAELGLHWNQPPQGINRQPRNLHEILLNIEIQAAAVPQKPAAVLVYGDTNSTLAGALFAAKIQVPLIHIEAGERSFNPAMPEETNRIVTDRLSDLLFCVNSKALANLTAERNSGTAVVAGDVMLDSLQWAVNAIAAGTVRPGEAVRNIQPGSYYCFTLHREVNTADEQRFRRIVDAVAALDTTIVWPVHPRCAQLLGGISLPPNFAALPPLGYIDSVYLMQHSQMVITDSGGLQKEAWWLKKKCITLREETEWTETLAGNCNMLETEFTSASLRQKVDTVPDWSSWNLDVFGNGHAAAAIGGHIKAYL